MTITTSTPRTTIGTRTGTAARTEAVSKFYGTGDAAVAALDNVSVGLREGQFTAIMGPSGSGKSTLLHMLAGLDRPDLGRGVPRRHRDHLAQGQGAHPAASRPDRLHLPVVQPAPDHDRGREHRAADADRRAASRTRTGWPRSSRPSGSPAASATGPRSSPAASSSASPRPGRWPSRPDIVFADEPTGALDSRSGAELLGFLRTAVKELGQTVVMVTHDATAASYADRVLFLADGHIVDEMHDRPRTPCSTT